MTSTVYLYQVWDTVTNQMENVWNSTEPTVSPINSNPIDTTKTVIIDTITAEFPKSEIDGYMLAVHDSAKPNVVGITTYAVWTSAGDNMADNNDVGGGPMLQFVLTPGTPTQTIRVQFNPINGQVWIHEAYIRFSDGGLGDWIRGDIVALATPLQQSVNLVLNIDSNNWIVPSSNGVGTHGFADATKIALLPRSFSKDGNWDWDGTTLTPNLTNNGGYKISSIDKTIHRFVNNIATRGTCNDWSTLSSNETTLLPARYVLDIIANNTSNTSWQADVLIEIFREKTHTP